MLIAISPFIYDNYEKSLSFIRSIRISLAQTQGSEADFHRFWPRWRFGLDSLKVKFYPKADISTRKPDLAIVTTREMKSAFIPFCKWKMQKGFTPVILAIEDIYENYTDQPTAQLKIKQCLYDFYKSGLKWVLIGGDADIVPAQQCYIYYNSHENYTPCDLFYTCFYNAFDWNKNGNNIVGEIDDFVDLDPKLVIGRIPVRDSMEVVEFTEKLLRYEQDAPTSEYIERILMTGTKLDPYTDTYIVGKYLYDHSIAPYWDGECSYLFDTYSDFGDEYMLSTDNLAEQIDTEYHMIFMNTHGDNTRWKTGDNDFYSSYHAAYQTNINASIIVTEACFTNAFDASCLSEAFLKNPDGGGVAYWGSSKEGWYPTGSHVGGVTTRMISNFFSSLFKGDSIYAPYTLGDVATLPKKKNISSTSNYTTSRWLQMSMNLLGDPTMTVHTADLATFINVSVEQDGHGNISVSTGGVDSCRITVVADDNMISPLHRISDNVSGDTFVIPPYPYIITITKHNYKPYICYSSDINDVYVQNRTYTGTKSITGNNIYVGKNVSTAQQPGNVVVSSGGSLTLDADTKVVLDKGTSCVVGGSLIVK